MKKKDIGFLNTCAEICKTYQDSQIILTCKHQSIELLYFSKMKGVSYATPKTGMARQNFTTTI